MTKPKPKPFPSPLQSLQIVLTRARGAKTEDEAVSRMAVRKCGRCTLCCVAPAIDEPGFKKPACQACHHVSSGGCAVYASRPPICADYLCAYVMGASDDYPAETGVCWTPQPQADGMGGTANLMVGHCADAARALHLVAEEVGRMLDAGWTVVLRDDREAHCFPGPGHAPMMCDVGGPLRQDARPETERPSHLKTPRP